MIISSKKNVSCGELVLLYIERKGENDTYILLHKISNSLSYNEKKRYYKKHST